MVDTRKKDAILQWLACYGHKLQDLSDLEDGCVLVKLLSKVDRSIDVEKVCPPEGLRIVEKYLRAVHGCLPAHFLVHAGSCPGGKKQTELATTAVLILSTLFVRDGNSGNQQDVAPLIDLEAQVQQDIKDMVQIFITSQDILSDLQEHLKASLEEVSPVAVRKCLKKKSEFFTFSPSTARSPLKRVVLSPQCSPYSVAIRRKDQQMKQLRKRLSDEETRALELEREVADLKKSAEGNEREITRLKAVIHRLHSDRNTGAEYEKENECLKSEVDALKCSLQSLRALKEDYDHVIRENLSLNSKLEELETTKLHVEELKESVLEALAQKSAIESKLADVIKENGALEAAVEEKEREIEAYREFFNSKDISMQSPRTPVMSPPRMSCFAEFCQVELEQTKEQLQETAKVKDRLEKDVLELQEKEAQGKMEISRLQETVAQLESSNENLGNNLSQATEQLKMLGEAMERMRDTEEQLRCTLNEQELQIKNLNEKLAEASLKIRVLEGDNAALKRNLQKSIEECTSERAKVSSLESDVRNLREAREKLKATAEENDALRCHLEIVLVEKASLEKQIEMIAEAVKRLEENCADYEASNKALTEERDKLRGDLEQSCQLVDNYKVSIADLKIDLAAAEQRAERASEAVAVLQEKAAQGNAEVSELRQVMVQLKSANETRENDLSRAMEQVKMLTATLAHTKEAEEQLRCTLCRKEQQISDLNEKLDETNSTLTEVSRHKDVLETTLSKREAVIAELEATLESSKCERDALQDQVTELAKEGDRRSVQLLEFETVTTQQKESICCLGEPSQLLDEARRVLENENAALKRDLQVSSEQHATEKTKVLSLESNVAQLRASTEEVKEKLMQVMEENAALKRECESRFRKAELDRLSSELTLLLQKNRMLTESCCNLRCRNEALCSELGEANRVVGRTVNENEVLKQKVHSLQESLARLSVERNSLQLMLEGSEAQKGLLETNVSNLKQTICDIRLQVQESRCAKDVATDDLEKLKSDFAKLGDHCKWLEVERERFRSELGAAETEKRAVQNSLEELEGQHQSLCDRYSDLECKLNRLQEGYDRSEEEYFKCVEEKERNKDELKMAIEELSRELEEKTAQLCEQSERCQDLEKQLDIHTSEIQTLELQKNEGEEKLAALAKEAEKMEVLKSLIVDTVRTFPMTEKESKENWDETDAEKSLHQLRMAIIAEKSSKAKSDAQKEKMIKKVKDLEAIQAEVSAKIKEVEEQRDQWKRKHEELNLFLQRRERQFARLTSEMKKAIASNSADVQKLKTELSEQRATIAALETERNGLELKNRQLQAEAKYCEQQMRDMRERRKGSVCSASVSRTDTHSFKMPIIQQESKQEFPNPHNASLSHTLNSSIFSENRFACDEEQDVFFETGLTDLQPVEADVFGRYGELHRRNSMLPAHLKSSYPVETQTSTIPATPLKEATFNIPDLRDENSKRKRPTVSSGSGSSAGSVKNPAPETPKKKTVKGTPSSLRKLIKRRFHRD